MGEKIGRPLTEETARPRVFPKTLPAPKPEEIPAIAPEKEKVPAEARRFTSKEPRRAIAAAMRLSQHFLTPYPDYTPKPVKEQAYEALETGIQRAAKFLGISEQQVMDMIVTFANRITAVLEYVGGTKGSTVRNPVNGT